MWTAWLFIRGRSSLLIPSSVHSPRLDPRSPCWLCSALRVCRDFGCPCGSGSLQVTSRILQQFLELHISPGCFGLFLYHSIQCCLIKMHLPAFFISFLSSSSLGFFLTLEDPSSPSIPSCQLSFSLVPIPPPRPVPILSQVPSRLEILESSSPVITFHPKSNFCTGLGLLFFFPVSRAVLRTEHWTLIFLVWCFWECVCGINFICRSKNGTDGRDSRVSPAHVLWSSGWFRLLKEHCWDLCWVWNQPCQS